MGRKAERSTPKGETLQKRDSAGEYHSHQAREQVAGLQSHLPKGHRSSALAALASKGDLTSNIAPSSDVSSSTGDREMFARETPTSPCWMQGQQLLPRMGF